jgi:hypothetical protein
MTDIIKLVPRTVDDGPDAEVIERIEALLERARAGEIAGIAYAVVQPGGMMGTGWCGGNGTRDRLGFALNILRHRYVQTVIDEDMP